uniref:Sodium-coupled monocarboxylate transporter 1 n=1 Tax=Cacopsylla melanoneura TaxID=428564 RepID=A0A8D8Z1A0_9HEMI
MLEMETFRVLSFLLGISSVFSESLCSTPTDSTLEPGLDHHFTIPDYIVLFSMLVISCAIGFFVGMFGEKQTTSDDFLLGSSSMGTLPMALSLAASFITAIELLGNPSEFYNHGSQFFLICISFVLVVPLTSWLYLPVFMKLRLTSAYEYLEMRFDYKVRALASGLYIIQMIFYTSVAVFAPALALSHVTGLNTYLAVTMVYCVCIFYASQGGMKAVILTDTFQAVVLLSSLVLLLVMGQLLTPGGFTQIWEDSLATNRIENLIWDSDITVKHNVWSVVIGGTVYWLSMFCASQASIQKYLSVQSIVQVRKALWVSAVGLIIIYCINAYMGAILYSNYKNCDPLTRNIIRSSDQMLPLYVLNVLGKYTGIPGFFVAGIFAASLGTVASAINSLAAVTMQDFLSNIMTVQIPDNKDYANIQRYGRRRDIGPLHPRHVLSLG